MSQSANEALIVRSATVKANANICKIKIEKFAEPKQSKKKLHFIFFWNLSKKKQTITDCVPVFGKKAVEPKRRRGEAMWKRSKIKRSEPFTLFNNDSFALFESV